jgi:hypothetical protein
MSFCLAGAVEEDGMAEDEEASDDTSHMLVLPSNAVSITECAENLFNRVAPTNTLFARNGIVMQAVTHTQNISLQRVTAQAFRSRVENYAQCFVWRKGANGEDVLKPTTVTLDMAGALLESEAVGKLPPIRGLINAPVLLNDDLGCRIVNSGYDKSGLLVTGGKVNPFVPVIEAIKTLQDFVSEFDFETGGDRSRALAMLLTPALKFGGHLTKHVPMNVCEADQSQTGKTYLVHCMTAIYNETASVVAQKKGGVGSDDENFASTLIVGRPFILFDNRRDKFDSTYLEAFITAPGLFPARVPHQGTIMVDPNVFMLSLTSNGIITTPDLANRSSIIRIRKKSEAHHFKKYPEGDLFDHVAANQGHYLGAVFSVITEWLKAGKPKSEETQHSFREWAQALDWIIQNILHESPLMEEHKAAKTRFSDTGMAFVRKIAIAVRTGGHMGVALTASEIYDLAVGHGVDVPTLRDKDRNLGARAIGTELGRLFKEEPDAPVIIEGFTVRRTSEKTKRTDGAGNFDTKKYTFTASSEPGQDEQQA